MNAILKAGRTGLLSLLAAISLLGTEAARAESAAEIEAGARAALKSLYEQSPAASALGAKAKAILVFPKIVKAGLVVGGQGGDGMLLRADKAAGFYNSAGVSYGLQAGIQSFGYALFLMTDAAVNHLGSTKGWEIGTGPTVVVVDSGMAKSLTTTTARSDVYAFTFGQKGLMAGVGLQGSKITRINP